MYLLRILFLVTLAAITDGPAMAANEFEDSIPIDVAEALFDIGGSGRFEVSSEIAEEFPAFQLPNGFTVLGSAYFLNSLRVALSTNLEMEEAVAAIVDSFINDDWEAMPNIRPFTNRTGFVAQNQVESARNILCHDQFGQLTVSSKSRGMENQIVLSAAMHTGLRRGWNNCAQLRMQLEQQMTMMRGRPGIGFQQYLPSLLMPEEGSSGRQPTFMIGSTSSSNNNAETDVELEIDWSMEEVFAHFAQQMVEQEWLLDADSVGSLSAAGTWARSPERGINLVANLNVLSLGDNRFQLRLSVEGLDGNSGANRVLRGN